MKILPDVLSSIVFLFWEICPRSTSSREGTVPPPSFRWNCLPTSRLWASPSHETGVFIYSWPFYLRKWHIQWFLPTSSVCTYPAHITSWHPGMSLSPARTCVCRQWALSREPRVTSGRGRCWVPCTGASQDSWGATPRINDPSFLRECNFKGSGPAQKRIRFLSKLSSNLDV